MVARSALRYDVYQVVINLNSPCHNAAFYKWLQQEYKADAVLHLGMHGTVEQLPAAPLNKCGVPAFAQFGCLMCMACILMSVK